MQEFQLLLFISYSSYNGFLKRHLKPLESSFIFFVGNLSKKVYLPSRLLTNNLHRYVLFLRSKKFFQIFLYKCLFKRKAYELRYKTNVGRCPSPFKNHQVLADGLYSAISLGTQVYKAVFLIGKKQTEGA